MFIKISKTGLWLMLILSLPVHAASYRSELHRSTQSKEWFSTQTFQANIIWNATYFSPDFRKAYEKRVIKKKYLEPLEAAQFVAKQEQRQSEVEEFFIGLYARKAYSTLELGKNSFWELILTTEDGEAIKPLGIEPVEVKPYDKEMFPYLDIWSKGYRVTFPKSELGKHFKLSIRSVIGESTLQWN